MTWAGVLSHNMFIVNRGTCSYAHIPENPTHAISSNAKKKEIAQSCKRDLQSIPKQSYTFLSALKSLGLEGCYLCLGLHC